MDFAQQYAPARIDIDAPPALEAMSSNIRQALNGLVAISRQELHQVMQAHQLIDLVLGRGEPVAIELTLSGYDGVVSGDLGVVPTQ